MFGQIEFGDYLTAMSLYDKACIDIKNEDYEAASEKLIESISMDSLIRGSYVNLYHALSKLNKYKQILPYLNKGMRIFLEDDELFYYKGNILQKTKDTDQAIVNYDSAVFYSKKNGEDYPIVFAYYLNRGICYLKQGKNKLALDDLSYAIHLNPENGVLYTNRGIAYYQLKNYKNSCLDWQKAKQLGQEDADNYLKKHCK